jgi:hypothetical protein
MTYAVEALVQGGVRDIMLVTGGPMQAISFGCSVTTTTTA